MNFNNCLRNLLKFIYLLQYNSVNFNNSEASCLKAPKLNLINSCFNTRVITLYNRIGNEFFASFEKNGIQSQSSKFRIQSVDGDCCVLLILDEVNGNFISTNQYITINISCICAIKCVQDVSITNL